MNNLKELQRTWYVKLKQTGFVDIERFGDSVEANEYMVGGIGHIFSTTDRFQRFTSRARFYRLISFFLHDHAFVNEELFMIFEGFAQGKTYRAIARDTKRSTYYVYSKTKEILEGPFKDYVSAFEEDDQEEYKP